MLLPPLVGHLLISEQYAGDSTGVRYIAAIGSAIVGYSIVRIRYPAMPQRIVVGHRESRQIAIALIVLAGLAGVHFASGGVPLFAANIETVRFDVTSSGLFGLPGRVVLFALPLLTGAVVFCAFRAPVRARAVWRSLAATCVGLFVVAQLLTGFRSALLTVAVVAVFAVTTATAKQSARRWASVGFVGAVVVAVAFAVMLSGAYATVAMSEGGEAILDRATVQAAQPGFVVMQEYPALGLDPGNSLINDASVFMRRYTGLHTGGLPGYSLDEITSAAVLGQPLAPDSHLVPVTVGAIPQAFFDFGWLALVWTGLVGAAYALCERAAISAMSVERYVVAFAGVIVLHEYLTKGNGAYVVLNWAAMCIAVLVLLLLGRALPRARSMRNGASADRATIGLGARRGY